ncbi:hypothetical protein ASE00_14745 [Sphingomonas sp. Root710]|uniref:DUF262 domain-containing protein n=1 Tax=Sphingomonas sp. Root710 TaxID=1736594 RepID=UPI0006FD46A9|nr:DUF262 domain-containing protein [Sphingomonas sp. Root710]KRB81250.1 hypothetical protein ASE00_14745 [Sphingomonas sp. Root710]
MKLTPTEPDIRTIVDRIDRGDIDLQPDFQRQEVWATKKQKRLIDTVLRGWSIPPVHLVETSDKRLEVLDGQQRLAALRDFVNNRFSIDGRITPADDRVEALHGRFYRQLDDVTRRVVDQYPLRCFRITDYSPEEPNELFYRLNQPTMLTAGEQRNALFGPARQQLKSLVNKFVEYGNDRETLGFSNLRLAYDDVLARLLFFLEAGNFGAKSTEGRISERFRSQEPFSNQVQSRAEGAVIFFSNAREHAEPFRYNKASLLSWLLFFSRFHDHAENIDLSVIARFIEASRGRYGASFVSEAVEVFTDRASLRVTDVSSVVYRDFVLCYLYHFLCNGEVPESIDLSIIKNVENLLSSDEELNFEDALGEVIDIDTWSHSL